MQNTLLADALNETGLPSPVVVQKHQVVSLSRGKKFVLIFGCPLHLVTEGIQVLPQCGGNTGSGKQGDPDAPRFNNAKIDLQGLLTRVSVDSINVSSSGQWCQVYVNCSSTQVDALLGFNHWGGVYEMFVRKALSNIWGTVTVRETNDKISLVLRKVVRDPLPATIHFAIK